MNDIYEILKNNIQNKERKILILIDNMIADVLKN